MAFRPPTPLHSPGG